MKKTMILALASLAVAPRVSLAQIKPMEIRAIRITAPDPAKLGDFYSTVFGFKRLPEGAGAIGRGAPPASATGRGSAPAGGGAANVELVGGTRMTIARRAPDAAEDTVAHLIFNVAQLNPLLEKAKANGAVVTRGPQESALKNMVAFIRDPGGNIVELVGPVPGATKIN